MPGQWPALVPEDQWRGLRALLTDPTRRTTDKYTRTYLGSGLYFCGVCGGPLTGNTTAGGGPGGRQAAYRCRAADRDGRSYVVRGVVVLDDFVVRLVLARLARSDAQDLLVPPTVEQTPLLEEAAALRARLDEVARGWAAGVLSQSQLIAASQVMQARLDEVEALLATSSHRHALAGLLQAPDIEQRWPDLTLDRRRAVVTALLEVTVLPRTRRGRLAGGAYFDPQALKIRWR